MKKGIGLILSAYLLWGILPIYWKWMHAVPPLQLLAHRISWSFLLLAALLFAARRLAGLWQDVRKPGVLRTYLLAAVLIAINWLTYIWAVNAGHLIESSLGYFINPLLSVLLGMFFLGEKLRPLQWLPLACAAAGVAFLTVTYGRLPWIALLLAVTFAFYGLVKKRAPLEAVPGLALETGLLLLPALGWLVFSGLDGTGAFLQAGPGTSLLLAASGPVTSLPLLLFAAGVKRIPLTTVGFLQYLSPTLQFLLGILVYGEEFDGRRLMGFGLVWLALLLFTGENLLVQRRRVPALSSD